MPILDASRLDDLFKLLGERGYTVIGPRIADGAIVYDEVSSRADLPAGWTDEQAPGHYRLRRRDDEALFGYAVGPHAWKRFLFPPRHRLWRADVADGRCRLLVDSGEALVRYAFIGVRACEVAALEVQDRVFRGGAGDDPIYAPRRENALVIVTQCTSAAPTCFCASLGTGPHAEAGYDLALTEVLDGTAHYFLVVAGSARGEELATALDLEAHDAAALAAASAASAPARRQSRALPEPRALAAQLVAAADHPHWQDVAARCLGCANCTLVCPTCFCHTVEDHTDLAGREARRERRWDSCFGLEFSEMHGGSVRRSTAARYRQWLTHKLGYWWEQFGTSGCVGCGRCLTWCPASIDITEEARRLT